MTKTDFWDEEALDREEYEFLPLDNIGSPNFFSVKNWHNIKELTFFNARGSPFTRKYLQTSKGLLPLSSVRLRRELKPFADSSEHELLTIQRWCDGSDTRSTTYKVELVEPVIVVEKKAPVRKSKRKPAKQKPSKDNP